MSLCAAPCFEGSSSGERFARCSVLSFSGWRSWERWRGGWESDQIPGILAGFLGFGPFPRGAWSGGWGARCGGTGAQAGRLGAEAGQPGAGVGTLGAGRGVLGMGAGSRGAVTGLLGSAVWADGSADGAPGGFQAAVPGNDVRLHLADKVTA